MATVEGDRMIAIEIREPGVRIDAAGRACLRRWGVGPRGKRGKVHVCSFGKRRIRARERGGGGLGPGGKCWTRRGKGGRGGGTGGGRCGETRRSSAVARHARRAY